jgi:hypothetical protein
LLFKISKEPSFLKLIVCPFVTGLTISDAPLEVILASNCQAPITILSEF